MRRLFGKMRKRSVIIQKNPKASAFGFWLGWRDSNPRDAGVKVLCLTAWRQPNMQLLFLVKMPIAKTMGIFNYFCGVGGGI